MITYDKQKPLISLHIPKTGGSALRKVLNQWYKDKLCYHYFDEENGTFPIKHDLLPGICIHGHFNSTRHFGVKDYYPEVSQFITFLRDPFEILVSRYFFVKKKESLNKSFRNGSHLYIENDVNEFLKKEIIKHDYHPNILDYFPYKLTFNNFKSIIKMHFIFIGLIEDFEKSIEQLSIQLGFEYICPEKINVTDRYINVDYKLRDLFIERHPLEYEVYKFVSGLLLNNNTHF